MSQAQGPEGIRPELSAVLHALSGAVIGKADAARRLFATALAGGHALIEDVPGTGKTLLARSFAQSLGYGFRRVQGTADLLPSDLLGVHVFDPAERRFEFRPGPVFTNVLLFDEINRASPRVQSALLEAMEEGQATIEGETMALPDPFIVVATENPSEHEGTFPLPDSQMDRFLIRIPLPYPEPEDELRILAEGHRSLRPPNVRPVLTSADFLRLRDEALAVTVAPGILAYVQAISEATRRDGGLLLGTSPRAAVGLVRLAKAWAFLHGRGHVLPDDVRLLASDALAHRLRARSGDPRSQLSGIVQRVPVPAAHP